MDKREQVSSIIQELNRYQEKEKQEKYYSFFKAKPGGYGEGDHFLGIRVPNIRKIAREYKNLSLDALHPVMINKFHEVRMLALIILINQFKLKKNVSKREEYVNFYLDHVSYVNNWDLVDISAPKILGEYFLNRNKAHIYNLAQTNNLWKERIAIISTFTFIRNYKFEDTLKLAEQFLNHNHDLIHKATGWMLREVGNRSKSTEVQFLDQFYHKMPRTMLRYAIEKFPEEERQSYLKGLK